MDKYIGIDVHASSCTIAILTQTGKRSGIHVVDTNGAVIVEELKRHRGRLHICFEEGTQSTWLYEILSPLVAEVVVVSVPEKKFGDKDDIRDALGLAELIRSGRCNKFKVYKEVGQFRALRSLVKAYGHVTQDMVRSCNRLKATYRSEGITTAGRDIYTDDAKADWLPKLDSRLQTAAGFMHDAFDSMDALHGEAMRAMLEEARKYPALKWLSSVPGIGPIRAAQILSVVVEPRRFRTKRQFWKYCGLGIRIYSTANFQKESGGYVRKQHQQTRGLNKDHNHLLKNVFKGAAVTVMQMARGPLYDDYQRMLKSGQKPNIALISLARKIAAITLSLWKKEQEYDETVSRKTNSEVTTTDDETLK